MTAKDKAIEDIKAELAQASKCFLAFHKELNQRIDNLVDSYIKLQESLNQ